MATDEDTGDVPPLVMLGLRLRKAREAKRWTLEKLSAKTKVSARHIENIERGDFHKIPSRTLVIGFTKEICLALRIKPEEVLAIIKADLYGGRDLHWQVEPEATGSKFRAFLRRLRGSP